MARRGKEPIDPQTGCGAKSNDATTWGTLKQALDAAERYQLDGIGIELCGGLCTEFRRPENASGILNWMLEGCRFYLCCGLNAPDSIKSATEAYREESDLIGTFVAQALLKKDGAFTLASAVYIKYQIWCEQNGYKKMSFKTFNRDIGRHLEAGHGKNGKIFKDCVIKISDSLSSQYGYE